MNICMFTNTYYPHVGGVARSVRFFAEDLRKMGHRVLIIAPTFEGLNEKSEEQSKILRVPAIQNFNGSDFSVRIALPFLIDEKIDEFQPNIIHSNHPFLLGDAALRAAHRRNLPIVFTHHTRYEDYTHYVPLDSKLLKQYVINLATEYANYCTGIVSPSGSIAELVRHRGVVKPIEVVPTGVDMAFFNQGNGHKYRQKHKLSENTMVIGHVGRLAPEKNLKFLAESVAEYLETADKAIFMVAGSGPDEATIQKIFKKKNIEDKLVMAGTVKGQELSDFYNALDIFVFASKTETQGMVLTEAMAAGKPVIALEASGVRDVMVDGENGYMLNEDASESDFACAIDNLSKRRKKSTKWNQAAVKTAKKFSRRNSAQKMINFYEFMINRRSSTDKFGQKEQDEWEYTLQMLKTEWDLISQKAKVAKDVIEETLLSSFDNKKKEGKKPGEY